MPENIPYKRGKEDMPVPGLTAAKAIAEALKAVEERRNDKKPKGRKHHGKIGADIEMPGKPKAQSNLEDENDEWGHAQDRGE